MAGVLTMRWVQWSLPSWCAQGASLGILNGGRRGYVESWVEPGLIKDYNECPTLGSEVLCLPSSLPLSLRHPLGGVLRTQVQENP
jgi:hypothetical protein